MVVSSSVSDISSWDDCDESSQASWDVISSADIAAAATGNSRNNRNHRSAGSIASAGSIGVIADLDAFNLQDDLVHLPIQETQLPHGHYRDSVSDVVSEDGTQISDTDLISIASRTSTVCCPLTLEAFRHPYYCEVDRRVYEKAAILSWVRSKGTSPLTRQLVRLDQLRPLDSDEEDNDSVSSEMGWPRPLGMFGKTKSAPSAVLRSSGRGFDFKSALLQGGGGVEGEKAKALTKKRAAPLMLPNSYMQEKSSSQTTQNSSKQPRGSSQQKGGRSLLSNGHDYDEEDEDDVFYAEYEARKGNKSTLVRHYNGRLLIRSMVAHDRSMRHYTHSLASRDYDTSLEAIDEDDGFTDDGMW